MTSGSSNKNNDTKKYIQLIEGEIEKKHINFHDNNEFQIIQRIGSGSFGKVYRANWKGQNTVAALKSFRNDNLILKEIVAEVNKKYFIWLKNILIINYLYINYYYY